MKPTKKPTKVNKKELLNLFGDKIQNSGLKPLRRHTNKKTAQQKPQEAVVIENLLELKELIKHLKPDDQVDPKTLPIKINSRGTKFASDQFTGIITIPQSGGQSMTRRTLLEGFEMLKKRQEMMLSLKDEGAYDGFLPAPLADPKEHVTWLDRFISNRLGGERDGLSIVWSMPEGKYRLDPWTCVLEKIDD